jgi:hypothetical protein
MLKTSFIITTNATANNLELCCLEVDGYLTELSLWEFGDEDTFIVLDLVLVTRFQNILLVFFRIRFYDNDLAEIRNATIFFRASVRYGKKSY